MESGILMTIHARGGCARELIVAVALLAIHRNVRTGQREVAEVVIERGFLPTVGRVTGAAVRAKAAGVLVILGVTRIAIEGRAFVHSALVAVFASHLAMFTQQREAR